MATKFKTYDGTQGSQVVIVLDLQTSEGEITLYSNLVNTIIIKTWNGVGYTAFTTGGVATVLDSSTNHAIIQGAGLFQITIPANTPLAVFVSLKALVKLVSEV